MGHINQFLYASQLDVTGPILEVGSKDYGNTQPFRKRFERHEYVGIDLEPGNNVDAVLDLSTGTGDLKSNHFGLVICCSVLEHCENPWQMAKNLLHVTRPGGLIYVAVPWVWRYHKYPDDYWRFSVAGLKKLFGDCSYSRPMYSTSKEREFIDIEEHPEGDNACAIFNDGRKYLPYLEIHLTVEKHGTGNV